MAIGASTAIMGLKPYTMLMGPSRSCMYLNNKPTSKPVNTRKPMVTERKGPNTKEIATSTITAVPSRSEEHTSELQSRPHLVCRLQLEKKKKKSGYLARGAVHRLRTFRSYAAGDRFIGCWPLTSGACAHDRASEPLRFDAFLCVFMRGR